MCKEMEKNYNPKKSEEKIYENWEKNGYFNTEIDVNKKPFSIIMPPPNITGNLHIGHALDQTMQDIMIRFKRMQGYAVCWIPGTDHASIATEAKIVEEMKTQGLLKEKIGKEEFLKRAWKWKETYGNNIVNQLKKLGISCDWNKQRFTMDEGCSKAVKEFFVHLYNKGLIYHGEKIINWCPKCLTSISDSEVEFKDQESCFWHLKYYMANKDEYLEVATTRPETIFGDLALAVNPNDERYKKFIGNKVIIPLVNREIPIIADDYVDIEVGTGVLKVTPAHDPNDFEIGLRHNLQVINVIDQKAKMNDNALSYKGLDRFEARKCLIQDLKELNLISNIKHIHHNVGVCYRCSCVIEPRISKQWFVDVKSLAKESLKNAKEGNIKFIPERFTKIYSHWMENIKDWCISRQLWWGHRIPVWHCNSCKNIIVSKEENVESCPKCLSKDLTPETDTMDTWFSAGLWPLSTLGWPEKTPELDFFFPASLLVTGHDLIFFWIARMIFSSLEITGQIPFKNILIHGLIRDNQGRKMSKSLGNGINPLEIIEKYGADALRFSLMLGNSPGNDIKFFMEKVENSRNFTNKIWNAARFIQMKAMDKTKPEKFDVLDCWIISKLNKIINEVTINLEKFDLGLAAQKLYDFIWNEFCDWYIEFSKLSSKGYVLHYVMENILKLIHPFMPFLTEEIWKSLDYGKESIMISEFPKVDFSKIDEKSEKTVEILMSIIKSIRNIRREVGINQNKKVTVYIESIREDITNILNKYKNEMSVLSYAKEIIVSNKLSITNCASAVNEYSKIYIPMDELIDQEAEILKLEKELNIALSQLESAKSRLLNENFISKAPENVVKGARENVEKLESKIEKLKNSISNLKSMSKN